ERRRGGLVQPALPGRRRRRRLRGYARLPRGRPRGARQPPPRGSALPAAHDGDARERASAAAHAQARGRARRRRLGALLPRAHRPGPAARRPGAARARAGARAALALPPPAALALPRQADLRPALPPDRGAVGARARRAALGAADDADERDVARLPVGERLLLRLARGRGPRL